MTTIIMSSGSLRHTTAHTHIQTQLTCRNPQPFSPSQISMFSRVASAGVAAFRRPVTAFTPSLWARSMATVQPAVLNRDMGRNQWYVHLSRTEGADLNVIKKVISDLRADCSKKGVNLVVGFGPTLLADITSDMPADFQPYETFKSTVRTLHVHSHTPRHLSPRTAPLRTFGRMHAPGQWRQSRLMELTPPVRVVVGGLCLHRMAAVARRRAPRRSCSCG